MLEEGRRAGGYFCTRVRTLLGPGDERVSVLIQEARLEGPGAPKEGKEERLSIWEEALGLEFRTCGVLNGNPHSPKDRFTRNLWVTLFGKGVFADVIQVRVLR